MMFGLDRETVLRLRSQYPKGTRVKLHRMDGENLPPNLEGTVMHVDDIGQIHVSWDNSSNLAINIDVDNFSVIQCS